MINIKHQTPKPNSAAGREVGSKHATIVKDGYVVPLIGVPPAAVLETCDLCGNESAVTELTWTGQQMLCKKCQQKS